MNWLNDKYNRAYSLKLQFENNLSELTIFYNKNNLYTAFTLDQTTYERTKRNGYTNVIFFDLNKSLFCKTFLDVKNFYTTTMDVKNQYNCIFPYHRDLISCELDESIVLSKHKVTWNKYPQENSISIRIFRLSLYENKFIYVLAERQLIDPVLHKKIIRTSAYQLGTDETTKYVSAMASKYNTQEVKKQTTEEALKSVFDNSSSKTNISKIERCGVL